MNLKSYMRGIGIGVLVTAAIFLIGGSNDKGMSDAQVIARAKELGMVESQTLSSISNVVSPDVKPAETASEPKQVEKVAEEELAEIEKEEEAVVEVTKPAEDETMADEAITEDPDAAAKAAEAEEAKKAEEEKKAAEEATNSDSVVIVVNPGDGSDTVARKLYEAGIVPNAHEFDLFLMANNYDRKITTGNHIISKDMTNDEIGKNLVTSTK